MNGEQLYKRYLELLRVDGGAFDNLEPWVKAAWRLLAFEVKAEALYKRAFEMSIVDRKVDMKFDNECEEADYWLKLAQEEIDGRGTNG